MIILSVNGLTKSFIDENILENLTFSISDRDKVGIVGDNGSGKTTLFNLLTKELSFDSGEINFSKNVNFSILHQNVSYTSENNVYDECLEVFEDIISLENELRELEIEMGNKNLSDDEMVKAMYVAAGIGKVIAENAFIAGAAGGCQGPDCWENTGYDCAPDENCPGGGSDPCTGSGADCAAGPPCGTDEAGRYLCGFCLLPEIRRIVAYCGAEKQRG